MVTGKFVVSLDMELMWGVRDKRTKETYGSRVLGERQAIPAMLDLFEREGIHATWAVVGMAMCDGLEELLARAPQNWPGYADQSQSSYHYLSEVGPNEQRDPYYFAPSMIRRIISCPNQEIYTHTFSHYYCLEPGQTLDQFSADIDAARAQLRDWNLPCEGIVFPRNQYARPYLDVCAAKGLRVFRGNENSWFYRAVKGERQGRLRRLGRITDSYVSLSGSNATTPTWRGSMVDVPSSRILRAYNKRLHWLESMRLRRIETAMTVAARTGSVFHLWWHPHNFGVDLAENLGFLRRVINHFRQLTQQYGMLSATMSEAAKDI